MSSENRQRRLYVNNRLEELRAKYGHESTWFDNGDCAEDQTGIQSEPAGAVSNGGADDDGAEPLPAPQKSLTTGMVTHPVAAPANALVDTLDL